MAELVPHPLEHLAQRMLHELQAHDSIFGLPRDRFFLGDPERDLSVHFHGQPAGSALGPAAGPHTQMAQNIVLAWLAGCRIFELKTVQVNDRLVIPRPCIDMATVGFNVEWSQELRLHESLEEYVKAAMLITVLRRSGLLPEAPGFSPVLFDMSVGYDLAGIQSEPVRAFIEGLLDATPTVERLRAQLPAAWRDLDFPTRLSSTLTLSTFHGCPPDEIERIIDWLLRQYGLDCVVKLNPTLLGKDDGRRILGEVLGYADLVVPDSAYDHDTRWSQMVDFVGRLGDTAQELGRGFGVKFTNTQIVLNHRDFFSAAEQQMYLSGPPLHVLAIELVRRFRAVFGDRFPVSFSAGIDRKNFADALALGLTPVTVCSDLLQPGGYGRGIAYYQHLAQRMDAVGASDLSTWTVRAHGQAEAALADLSDLPSATAAACRDALASNGDLAAVAGPHWPAWVSAARLRNTEAYADQVLHDPRYGAAANSRPPRKVKSTLVLLDCLTCDKCLPVCPNTANFTFDLPPGDLPAATVWLQDGRWQGRPAEPVHVDKKHQIGNYVDFCNDCGNCDVFCPELGGPYRLKARFHGSLDRFQAEERDGLFVDGDETWARLDGRVLHVTRDGSHLRLQAEGVDLRFRPDAPLDGIEGTARGEVDLGLPVLLDAVRRAVQAQGVSWVR